MAYNIYTNKGSTRVFWHAWRGTMNRDMEYTILAEEIVLAALQEAQGKGEEAHMARQWLKSLGVHELDEQIRTVCATLQALWTCDVPHDMRV
jgi:hypothetical protein